MINKKTNNLSKVLTLRSQIKSAQNGIKKLKQELKELKNQLNEETKDWYSYYK